jgi:hypothetical protein
VWVPGSWAAWLVPLGAAAAHVQPPGLAGPDDPGPFSLARRDRIEDLLATAGFREAGIQPVTAQMRIGEDIGDVMEYFLGLGIVRAMLAAASPEGGAAAAAAVRDALAPHQEGDGVLLGGAAWLVSARR